MDQFSFGARDNGIIQIAYTVADIQKAMRHYTELLRVGQWFPPDPACSAARLEAPEPSACGRSGNTTATLKTGS